MDVNQLKETIGRRLKQARKECDLTQDEVAEKLGLTSVGYGSFERGANLIALNYLIEVSRIFGKPLTYFLPTPYVTPEELDNLLSHDPNLQYFISMWPILPEPIRNLFLNQIRVMTYYNTDLRAAMTAVGMEVPEPPEE